MNRISIQEEDFLKATNVPVTSQDDAQKKRREKLIKELDKVWDKYTPRPTLELEEELVLPRLSHTLKTERQLKDEAKKLLSERQIAERDAYLKGVDELRKNVQRSKSLSKIEQAEERASAERKHNAAGETMKNNAVRKGLAHSSVLDGKKDQANSALSEEIAAAERKYQNALKTAKESEDRINRQEITDLNQIDAEHKKQTGETVQSLREEDLKTHAQVVKTNNDAEAKEMAYNKKVKEENAARTAEYERLLAEYESKDAQYVDDIQFFSEMARTIKDFYENVDPKVALEEFRSDPEMKKRLGKYYNLVYSGLKGRIPANQQ